MNRHKTKLIAPMLAVADMQETIGFYTEVLLFDVLWKSPDYSVLKSGDAKLQLMLATDEDVLNCVRGHTEIYIEVEGIETLWEHVKHFKGQHRMKDLFDRDYGMREFHISDPNECLVFLGEEIRNSSP